MVLYSAKIVRRRRKQLSKIGNGEKFYFFKSPFSPGTNVFFKHFLLVSNAKLWEMYDKKSQKIFFTWEKRR
jgi:hypothetical protein